MNFWGWGLEFQRSNVRIGEIANSAEYRMDEQNQNLPIFEIKLKFSKLKKKFQKFPKFYNFENHQISIIDKLKNNNKISEIVEFQKLASFQNLTICTTQNSKNFQFGKLSYILSVRTI